METYRGWWALLKTMPEGWQVDKTAGSPLYGHVFITDGKSILHGQKRALLLSIPLDKWNDYLSRMKPQKRALLLSLPANE